MGYPGWLGYVLWITYGVLLVGLLRAWWVPYLFGVDAERRARYGVIFKGTHRFLPQRYGIAPDTLHVSFHAGVVVVVVMLWWRGRMV